MGGSKALAKAGVNLPSGHPLARACAEDNVGLAVKAPLLNHLVAGVLGNGEGNKAIWMVESLTRRAGGRSG